MKSETAVGRTPLAPAGQGGLSGYLADSFRRIPQRVRERRFWEIQALVLVSTGPHYVIEILGFTNPFETLHGLTITLYIMPLLYASLNYGREGAVMTGLWAAFLTSPSLWIWHRSEFLWFTELGQLAITLPVGLLVAWRVDRETKERIRAERTSASLRLLNEVGQLLSHTLEVEQQIPQVLRKLISGLELESAWVCLEGPPGSAGLAITVEGAGPGSDRASSVAEMLHRWLASGREAAATDGRAVAVLMMGDTGVLGSMGGLVREGEQVSESRTELLVTVAQQLRVALENARLYRQRQESLQSYVRQVTQAQEDERLRIARELHDETAQELVHLARKLEQLRAQAAPALGGAIDELLTMTRATMQAVRRYSRDLRPSVLDDLGLVAAIEMVVEETSQRLAGGAHLEVTGTPRRLDGPVELALFRIAQEALRNIEKHAGARSANVKLEFSESAVRLSVIDDGRGFTIAKGPDLLRSGKLGLLGMRERAELVGAEFEIQSEPGQGTRVSVLAPAGGARAPA